ncbi:MAG: vitamin K epoxide reductase family protein [Patescibacteria group bacterium]
MKKDIIWKWISVLSFIGILLATYLYYSYLTQPEFRPCSINATVNCDAVISGEVALTLGIPTALYGLIGYIVIFLGSLFKKAKLVLAVATFGLLFCLYILSIEIFQLGVYCPVCLGCLVVMISVFFLSVKLNKNAKK